MTEPQTPDLLGLTEIAELYGVHKQTVNGWRRNSSFPAPARVLAMGPIWRLRDLVAWKKPDNGDFRLLKEDKVFIHCAHCKGKTRPMTEGDVSNGGSRGTQVGLARVEVICTECEKTTLAYFANTDSGVLVATNW